MVEAIDERSIEFRIKVAILAYPSLYQSTGRMGVLDQFFCTNGNGLEWHEGAMREKPVIKCESVTKAEAILRAGFEIPFRIWNDRRNPIMGPTMYPLCQYAKICNLPLNIRPDWLAAAREVLDFLKENRDAILEGSHTCKVSQDKWVSYVEKKIIVLERRHAQANV